MCASMSPRDDLKIHPGAKWRRPPCLRGHAFKCSCGSREERSYGCKAVEEAACEGCHLLPSSLPAWSILISFLDDHQRKN